ncbi:bifunctional acetyl transferase/isomerase [Photobacterium leiognathi lrivu.4.1]|uniref:Bifunctional acetyl transferase/isomerase n=1 Tax=Photobacterium leiognathi lrivu.4.1 TaxID=1248232 RepID=X0P7Q7_PHOLE|nr:FdtA/QdtA family cupin domain-containing protein [Photobacterium leiognathi]GAD28968.1 bifunctional acetyl transferase/isomerase [Photobacterium leiognathi lrivu.4.1]
MSLIKLIEFSRLGDDRGALVSLEQNKNIPFDIKRVYYIFDTKKGVARGFHAHKDLQQVAICIKGSCRFIIDDGSQRESVLLDKANVGLLIDSMMWREMHDFSEDCVLMVIASRLYDEADYIRDYDKFLGCIKNV